MGFSSLTADPEMRLCSGSLELRDRGMLLAALSAGVELQGLHAQAWTAWIPFRVAVALTGTPWTDFADLLPPPDTPWVPPEENGLGEVFLKVDRSGKIGMLYLCKDLLEIVQTAQVSLAALDVMINHHGDETDFLSLLECAILLGQSDCAALLATEGVELSYEGSELLLMDSVLDWAPQWRPAAMAAAHVALSKTWKVEIAAKGIAIYQLMKKLARNLFQLRWWMRWWLCRWTRRRSSKDLDLCQEASA